MTDPSLLQRKRPNWAEFVIDEISFVDVPAVQDASFVALKRGTMEKGGEQMEVNRELLMMLVGEALKPLVQEVRDLNRRLDRLPNLTPRLPKRDTFSDAVRGRTEFDAVEKAARAAFRQRDPFGAAVLEKRRH